jgi:hypothetical protein
VPREKAQHQCVRNGQDGGRALRLALLDGSVEVARNGVHQGIDREQAQLAHVARPVVLRQMRQGRAAQEQAEPVGRSLACLGTAEEHARGLVVKIAHRRESGQVLAHQRPQPFRAQGFE